MSELFNNATSLLIGLGDDIPDMNIVTDYGDDITYVDHVLCGNKAEIMGKLTKCKALFLTQGETKLDTLRDITMTLIIRGTKSDTEDTGEKK